MDIQFDVPKCKLYFEKKQFKTLVVLSHVFVTNTKVTFGCNFVISLIIMSLLKV